MPLDFSVLAFQRGDILSFAVQKERNRRAVLFSGEAAFAGPVPVWENPVHPVARPGLRSESMAEQDKELARSIIAAQAGDGEAFRHVFSRFSKPVLSFIYSLVGDAARSEELAQETFIRAFRNLRSLRNPEQLSTWLFGIARNVVREAVRQKYRDNRTVNLEEADASSVADRRMGPEDEVEADELNRTIRDALAALPEDRRIVFVLKMLHQMRYEEIAVITGASVGKLKTDLHRARSEMRRRLAACMRERGRDVRGDES